MSPDEHEQTPPWVKKSVSGGGSRAHDKVAAENLQAANQVVPPYILLTPIGLWESKGPDSSVICFVYAYV